MSSANWLQLLVLVAAVLATTPLLGAYLAARPRRRPRARRPGLPPRRADDLPRRRRRSGPGAAVERLRALAARVQRRLDHRPLPAPAPAGRPLPQPDRGRRRPAGARLQHRGQLRHEHELAELRRRVDDEPSHADGRPDGAELRVGRRRDRRCCRARPRDRAAPLGDDRQLLGRPDPDDDARARPARRRGRARLRQPGRRPDAERQRRRGRPSRAPRSRSTVRPSRARRRSRSSARTEAGSRTRTRRIRSRTRTAFTNLVQLWAILAIPFALTFAFGRLAGDRRQGWARLRRDVRALDRLGRARDALRDGRQPARRGAGRQRRRRQHGRQGGALRRRHVRPLRRHDDRHLDGCGQRRPRQLHAARRRRPAREHDARGGQPRRRRRRPLRDARLRPAGGLHRRSDGRADAGVPGQEDPGGGDEARRPLPALRPDA